MALRDPPSRPGPDPRRDIGYRLIQMLMLADLAVGLALLAAGALWLDQPALVTVGAGLAAIGLALFLFFRRLAARAAAGRR
jgi:hypothetical protein